MSTEVETQDVVDEAALDVEQIPSDEQAVEESGSAVADDVSSDDTDDGHESNSAEQPAFSDVDRLLLEEARANRVREETKAPDEQQKKEPEPEPEFEVKLDPDLFDDPKQAEAVEALVKRVAESSQAKARALEAKIAEQQEQLQQASEYIQQTKQADPNVIYESVRKEIADEFGDEFGVPAAQLRSNPEVLKKAAALLDEMSNYASAREARTGIRPPMDGALARKVIAMCDGDDGHPLQNMFTRAKRNKIKNGINGKAASASPDGGSRKSSPRPKTREQTDAELEAYADAVLSGKIKV
jgi:hypothetical protein